MSNSPLVNYTSISPNRNPREDTIKKITIHHMAGNLSVEGCGSVFAPSSRGASSNYGVDSNGIVGMYVEEKDRAWTSGNRANDHQAVTIEIANDGGDPDWHVSDTALAKTIELCADICRRNGIARLNYTGDASGNLTRHNMFEATGCPGPYLQSKFGYIADEVNKLLGAPTPPTPTRIDVIYQSNNGSRWLPRVKGTEDYAGNLGEAISGIYAELPGRDIYYRVHVLAGDRWLPEVKNLEDYAGNLGEAIDAVQIRVPEGTVRYRVHNIGRVADDWCNWVTCGASYGSTSDDNAYAGNEGVAIDAIQIEIL